MPASAPVSLLRVALLGCGFATKLHSRTLARFGGEVQRFYASRDAARAEQCNRRYRGSGAFGSYEAAIASPEIDVVLIATPPASHLDLTLRALEHGKHVIVEKPPFLRSTDLDTVEEAAARAGRQVMVAENYYYKPLARTLREVLAAGEVGEARVISINALKQQRTGDWRDQPEQAGGGALFEGGIHWVNFMAHLGLPVVSVQGYRPAGPGPERTVVAVFQYEGGVVGTLYYSWEIGSPMKGLRLSALYGTEGAATFESNGLLFMLRGRRRRLRIPEPTDLLGYRAMFRDFFRAIRTGTEPEFGLDKARYDLQLVEALYRSMERNQPIHTGDPL
jgi:UDP-N-acetylglucosamine 3-dehydrogenase